MPTIKLDTLVHNGIGIYQLAVTLKRNADDTHTFYAISISLLKWRFSINWNKAKKQQ